MSRSTSRTISSLAATVVGDRRRWRAYQARVAQLPADHRGAVEALERYLMSFGPADGEGAMSVLEDLASRFERAAAQGTGVRAVVGGDPVRFADDLLAGYEPTGWAARERARLTDAVARAAGERP